MIITKEMLKKKVPEEMIPTRLDSALNLYTNIRKKNQSGILVYHINPDTWNQLYPFYELNYKFTMDHYHFHKENPTYQELIEEYQSIYKEVYEKEKGYTKEKRILTLIEEYKKTFHLKDVTINEELGPIYELKYSKSKNVWTLYYFENYVASKVENLNTLYHQTLYEQKILPLDSSIKQLDGIEITSNIPYLLSIKSNIQMLEKNIMKLGDEDEK